jgi:hypothetical protein
MAVQLPSEEIDFFKEHGYLIIRHLLTSAEVENLQQWAQEVHDWTPSSESIFMPYEVCSVLIAGNRLSAELQLKSE